MKAESASRTAEFVALFRALETAKPPKRRFFEDPLAVAMLPATLRVPATFAKVPVLREALIRFVDSRWPRTRSSAVARTKLRRSRLPQNHDG
jgi:O-methyltransferase involved in polyketide biosynthesis